MYHSYTGSPLLRSGPLPLRRREPLSGWCVGSSRPWRLSRWSGGPRNVRFGGCGPLDWLPRGMWNLPGPGVKLVSPVLAARVLDHQRSPPVCVFKGMFMLED